METCHLLDTEREKGFLCRLMDCADCNNWRKKEVEKQIEKIKATVGESPMSDKDAVVRGSGALTKEDLAKIEKESRERREAAEKIVNMNELAGEVAKIEGGHQNLSIAQIKEVMSCYHKVLRSVFCDSQLLDIWLIKITREK